MNPSQQFFHQQYTTHIDEIYRFVFFAVGQHQPTAEDITSTVFLKAWKTLRRFDSKRAPFRTYLYTIARSCVADHWRQQRPLEEIQEHSATTTDAPPEFIWQTAQAQLSPDAYTMLVLKYQNDLTIDEIAEATQTTSDAVKSSLKRSRQQLASLLKLSL